MMTPDIEDATRHPWFITMKAIKGVTTLLPIAIPMDITPKAVPRFRTNHRVTKAAEQLWNPALAPNEITPMKINRKTAKLFAIGSKTNPIPVKTTPMAIMILGPQRSIKNPEIGLCSPPSRADNPNTSDVEAWLRLRSRARERK